MVPSCRDVSSACDGKSVLAAGAVRESADVGLVDGVQERAVTLKNTHASVKMCLQADLNATLFPDRWIYLDQSKQSGLKLVSGQNWDLWLQWEFGEKEGMLCAHSG